MEIRRFGPGYRRPDGPPGTQGITGAVLHSDARGIVSVLAFSSRALIAPHANGNTTLFIVISGGGWVQVGQERSRVIHGECVVWPAGELHGAYTEGSEMTAMIVEFTGADDEWVRGILELTATSSAAVPVALAEGALVRPERTREEHDEREGEPY
jgi:quercetin dioxygenase-like cupin family protein